MDIRLRRAARAVRDEVRDLAHPLVDELIDTLDQPDDAALADTCHRLLVELDDLEPCRAFAQLETVLFDDPAEPAPSRPPLAVLTGPARGRPTRPAPLAANAA